MNKHYQNIADEVINTLSLKPLNGKSVLITGANGLIGSHMLSVLAEANKNLNLNLNVTASSRSQPAPWIKNIFMQPGFKFINIDLVNASLPWEGQSFDYVIHAATYGQPKKFLENPLQTMILNSKVTESLLELTAKTNGTFLFMSSSEIYGNPPIEFTPTQENYHGNVSPLDQRSPYTSSKRFGETLCKVYNDMKKVRARIARVSSVYGPGVNLIDDRVLNVFIRRAIEEKKLKLMDQGEQKRRWLYITDALVMFFYILLYSKELVYNVGGVDLRSVGELANYIGKEVGVPVVFPDKSTTAGHTVGAPTLIDIDTNLIRSEAKMEKLTTLEQGLKSCIAWTNDLLKGNV